MNPGGVVSSIALMLFSPLAFGAPLSVRDQNPLLAGFDVPAALPAQLPEGGCWLFETTFAWSNSALVQATPRESLLVDAETQELRMMFGRSFANGYALRVELPYRRTRAGTLDGFIDDWHGWFGLPEGARPMLPRNALDIVYEREGERLIELRSPQSGLGDVSVQLGKQLGASPMTAWLALKLPTGEADAFTGSGSIDATAALAIEHAFGERYAVFAQVAGTWLGDGDRMKSYQKEAVGSVLAGISAKVFERLTLTAQLDAHTAVYESGVDFLGAAVMLSLGGTFRLADRWDLSFAVTEDIAVETAADVVFLFELKRSTR